MYDKRDECPTNLGVCLREYLVDMVAKWTARRGRDLILGVFQGGKGKQNRALSEY
jgi:hypothetical protein